MDIVPASIFMNSTACHEPNATASNAVYKDKFDEAKLVKRKESFFAKECEIVNI